MYGWTQASEQESFLIARSIQLQSWGSTECENLLYFLDLSSKVYNMNFLGILKWKLPKLKVDLIENCQNWKLPKLEIAKIENDFSFSCWKLVFLMIDFKIAKIESCQDWK